MGQVYQILDKKDSRELAEFLMANAQGLLPTVELIEQARMAVDDFVGKGQDAICDAGEVHHGWAEGLGECLPELSAALRRRSGGGSQMSEKMSRRTAIRRMAAGAAGIIAVGGMAMRQNQGHASEAGVFIEKQETGSEIWQVTTEEVQQSNIYCEVPYCSADSRFFVYHRSSRDRQNPEEFVIVELGTWQRRVLDTAAMVSGCAVTPDGTFYYVKRAGDGALDLMRAGLSSGEPEVVHRFGGGPWTWDRGTVSADHRYYVRGKRLDDEWKLFGVFLLDLETDEETIIDKDPYLLNIHPQFDPATGRQVMIQHNRGGAFNADGTLQRLVGPEGATLFLLSVPEGQRTELQVGKPYTTPCTGHEAWAGETGEMVLTVSPSGDYTPDKGNLLGVRAGSPARTVARGYQFNHVGVSRCGRLFICDDWRDDYKIVIGSVKSGKTAVVCASKTQPGRSQNTHPHAYLTPDLKWVIFNSNRTGFPHVYAASVPEGIVAELLGA